jgi:spoIIIJ-associated protein
MSEQVLEGAGDVTEEGSEALATLRRLLELSGMSSGVELTETDDRIRLNVTPENEEDASLLVGRQGRTLSAYQFIMNRMVRRGDGQTKPVSVDVSGYGERRREQLEELAGRLAETVANNEIAVHISAMNPSDRRSVHLALEGRDGLRTYSEDEGIARRLVVSNAR